MDNTVQNYISEYLSRTAAALQGVAGDPVFAMLVGRIASVVTRALAQGGKLLIVGNGGSAADAQHMAAEFLARFVADRRPLPAIALTTDTSVLTAIGNDYGFEQIFARQVRGLGQRCDVLLALSTSGRSPNVLAALKAARDSGITTIGLTGAGGQAMSDLCDLCLVVPAEETAIIQQIHMVVAHMVCGLVEQELVGGPR